MTANIVVRTGPGETRYALTVGGVLTRQMVRRDSDAALLGTIYRGQIVKLHKGLNAAFVDLGDGREGFLSAQDAQYFDGAREKPRPIGEVYTEGESVLVQVTREASDGKGPKLTGRLSLASPNLVLTPLRPGVSISKKIENENERARLSGFFEKTIPRDLGVIARTNSAKAGDGDLEIELEHILQIWTGAVQGEANRKSAGILIPSPDPIEILLGHCPGLDASVTVGDSATRNDLVTSLQRKIPGLSEKVRLYADTGDIFDQHDLHDQWAELYSPVVPLSSGGRLHIHETAAATMIDVDSGGGNPMLPGDAFNMAVNAESTVEIGRQIPLREISGQIVIDFLPVRSKEKKNRLEQDLTRALGSEARDCMLFGDTKMGLFEMSRRRGRRSFAESHMIPFTGERQACDLAYDVFYDLERESKQFPGKGLKVICSQPVTEACNGEPERSVLEKLKGQILAPVEFQPESRHCGGTFEIEVMRT